MKRTVALMLLLLAGCAGLPKAGPQAALYDFGIAAPAGPTTSQLRLANVAAAAGLTGSDMRYRLAYQDPAQVFFYTESRWIAPPARLLARHFEQRLAQNDSAQCSLRITVETFDQIFDTPVSSRGVVRLHASLVEGGRQATARTLLATAERPAATADARGGVTALIGAADDAFTHIIDWAATSPCAKTAQYHP